MATKQRETDWLKKEMFTVEIEGITWGHFASVSGGDAEAEIIVYKNSDEQWERKRPGRIKYSNITLERGFIDDAQFKDWIKTVESANVDFFEEVEGDPAANFYSMSERLVDALRAEKQAALDRAELLRQIVA